MTRLGGCVVTLSPQARQILIWRAGLGAGPSYDRLQVARLLGTSVPRERALEQRAAADLRRTAAQHGCGRSAPLAAAMMIPTAVSAGLHQALEPLAGPGLGGPAAPVQAPGAAAFSQAAGSAAVAAHNSHAPSRSHRSPARHPRAPGSSKLKLSDSGPGSPSLLLIGLALVGAAILLTPLARKFMPEAATQFGVVELAQPDRCGDPEGAFNLGCLLAERGDVSGALTAYRRAAERGHPSGASNLGVLLEQRGDVDGALEAYRTAAEGGDPQGAFNLGGLLAERGDLSGAAAAYARAEERGGADVAAAARSAIDELGGQRST